MEVTTLSRTSSQAEENERLNAAMQGDAMAYRRLYEQYVNRVYSLCLRLTGEQGLAEDATQEVFIQVWHKLANFDHRSQFSTWLHSVTANVTISYMRKQKSWLQRVFNLEQMVTEPATLGCSTDIDLEHYILKLPERARVVFVLHAIEGYRHDDIAAMLNIASGTSKAQYFRARHLLVSWMGESDE